MSVLLDDNLIWIAVVMGVAGSAHCVGMCGGFAVLASATPAKRAKPSLFVVSWLAGKTLTYAVMGAILGALGQIVPTSMSGFQTVIVILTSAMLVVTGLHLAGVSPGWSFVVPSQVSLLVTRMSSMLKTSTIWTRFVLGLLNGLLPCGLVYAALAYSLTYQSVTKGALFMAVFGIGTMPALVLIGFGAGRIATRNRQSLMRILGWLIVLLGLLTLTRLPFLMNIVHDMDMTGMGS
jgi:sulfite exporter TauE/SafE